MRLLRGLLGALLWILAAVLGLVGVLLCVTVILLPVGIPVVKLAGSMFVRSVRLMLPPALAHPVDTLVAHPVDTLTMAAEEKAAKSGRRCRTRHARLPRTDGRSRTSNASVSSVSGEEG